jgi:ferritin-like metal-binding protein YciE
MSEITNPRELFLHELGDILYVERTLAAEALPKLIDEVADGELRQGLEKHLVQTRRHITNVEKVFENLGETPQPEKCVGFEGLKSEHDKLSDEASSTLIDLVDLGAAARTEHYEIAAYQGLIKMARALGESDVVAPLEQNLKQEKETLREIEKLTTRLTKEQAKDFATA